MGLINTQVLGFGEPKPKTEQKADPKPVRGFNYAGQPMNDGEFYNGRPEHMKPAVRMMETVRSKITPKEERTPSQISAMRTRMARARAALAQKRAQLKA